MSFIRKKEIPPGSGNYYNYLVESARVNGKVKQVHLEYLGRSTGKPINSINVVTKTDNSFKKEKVKLLYENKELLNEKGIAFVEKTINENKNIWKGKNIRFKIIVEKRNSEAATNYSLIKGKSYITLKLDSTTFNDIPEMTRKTKQLSERTSDFTGKKQKWIFSTGDKRHYLWHELGHIDYFIKNDSDTYIHRTFTEEQKKSIEKNVSAYASTKYGEFYAEVFAMKKANMKVSPEMEKLYKRIEKKDKTISPLDY